MATNTTIITECMISGLGSHRPCSGGFSAAHLSRAMIRQASGQKHIGSEVIAILYGYNAPYVL